MAATGQPPTLEWVTGVQPLLVPSFATLNRNDLPNIVKGVVKRLVIDVVLMPTKNQPCMCHSKSIVINSLSQPLFLYLLVRWNISYTLFYLFWWMILMLYSSLKRIWSYSSLKRIWSQSHFNCIAIHIQHDSAWFTIFTSPFSFPLLPNISIPTLHLPQLNPIPHVTAPPP